MRYDFLVETYETERTKVISTWSMFRDKDLPVRPHRTDTRGRSFHEHMVHQCVSEDIWFRTMLDIDVGAPPLPKEEVRLEFMRRYEEDSGKRLVVLGNEDEAWWEGETTFFDVRRSRAWVITRRMTHTAHHRGQQLALLRMLGREAYSNYGPTADTGGLMQSHAPTIYAYPNLQALLEGEAAGGRKTKLPGPGTKPVTERPDEQGSVTWPS
ncbi:MAG TPA: DinB family protein [Bryobacteraceae bacterium]|nr:DinB family protein [Bryobacteraceae bacterium]